MSAKLLALALLATTTLVPQPAAAAEGCRFVVDGDDLAVTVALRGAPDLRLTVDWGDGTTTRARDLDSQRERAFLRHQYGVAGPYRLRIAATSPSGFGCSNEMAIEVPYEGSDAPGDRALLPPRGTRSDDEEVPLESAGRGSGSGQGEGAGRNQSEGRSQDQGQREGQGQVGPTGPVEPTRPERGPGPFAPVIEALRGALNWVSGKR